MECLNGIRVDIWPVPARSSNWAPPLPLARIAEHCGADAALLKRPHCRTMGMSQQLDFRIFE
jgi:hypothetical protein